MNGSKTDTFHKPTTYEPHVQISSEEIIIYARQSNGRVGFFRIKNVILSFEVIAFRKVPIFKLFPSNLITL